jgi:aryl-alcohol dehydrogenase-like predicted oxidoreductase
LKSSAIGFGCASLGSRVSKRQGLQAVASAFAQGVTWFDVAPVYGAGGAESILGEFVRKHRGGVILCTKVGRGLPPRNRLLKAAFTAVRPMSSLMGGLRKAARRLKTTRNESVFLSPSIIRASLERSLIQLNSDYVDVFALHEPPAEILSREDILRVLEDIVREGKARYIGVAGSHEAAHAALSSASSFQVLQLADDPYTNPLTRLRLSAGRPLALVSHSVLGVGGAMDRLAQSLRRHPEHQGLLREAGYDGSYRKAVADLLIDRALASNPEGVVLFSMFSKQHLATNIARASKPIRPEAIELVDILVKDKLAPASLR